MMRLDSRQHGRKELNQEDIKRIQLDILQAVHAFCLEHGIVYSLACGAMLGAVRHKGYIPWDDDIDIYLLRSDYQKLSSLFPKVLDNRYELISLASDIRWDRPYSKIYDNRTVVEENAICDFQIGVGIDLYPIDDVPDSNTRWKLYNGYRRIWQRIAEAKRIKRSKHRGTVKEFVLLFTKIITLFVSRRHLAEYLSRVSQWNNNKGYARVFECVQGMLQKNPFPKNLFYSVKLYPFEDRFFCGFADADTYLKNGYGDYMKMPPVEKRVSHHDILAYWI